MSIGALVSQVIEGFQAPVTPKNPKALQDEAEVKSEFQSLLKSALSPDKGNNVNEEELFSALVSERISTLKGADVAKEFKELLDKEKAALKKPNGYVPVEEATISALKKFAADKKITAEEGDKIYSEAFDCAQLDENKNSLFDSIGGNGDPTVAMAKLDVALSQAKAMMDKFVSGEQTATARTLGSASATGKGAGSAAPTVKSSLDGVSESVAPKGTTMDGPDGFLWKPITNNDNKLAVLLSASVTGQVMSVLIKDKAGNLIEEGKLQSAGIKETGREKYVFSKKGGEYPKDVVCEVKLADGSVKSYSIPDPSKRYD